MEQRRAARRKFRRGLVILLLLAAWALPVAAQEATQTELASISFEPERVVRGNRFTVSIRTDIPWTRKSDVQIGRPELPRNLAWWGYPDAQYWTGQTPDGSSQNYVEIRAVIRVDAPGFFELGPFFITSGGRRAETRPKKVIGLEADEADRPYPVFTAWRSVPETVWQGQTIPLVLEARNLASLALADTVSLSTAAGGLLEPAPGLGGIGTRPFEHEILYDVPMASWMWTLADTGRYSFPAVRLNISGMTRVTPGFTVDVRPLPDAVLDSGAVGRFRVDYSVEEGNHRLGDIVSVRVRVEGEGNLNVFNPPVPELTGASLVGQGSSSSFIPGPSGYEGWREERYDFQLEETGDLTLTLPGWNWMEPVGEGRIRRSSPERSFITVAEALVDGKEGQDLELLGAEALGLSPAAFHWLNSYWFLLALPGFLVLVVVFLLKSPAKSVKTSAIGVIVLPLLLSATNMDGALVLRAAAAADSAVSGDWEAAGTAYRSLLDETGEHPGLLHDLAIVEKELGRPDLAVGYMRRANVLRPGSALLKTDLARLEAALGLDSQIPLSPTFPLFFVFAFLLLMINLGFLAVALLLHRRDARTIILSLSVFLLLLGSVGLTFSVSALWTRPTAVVVDNSDPLRKIPGPLATDWIQLPAGTAVSIVAAESGDYLVRTGFGLEGWLPGESLNLMTESLDGF